MQGRMGPRREATEYSAMDSSTHPEKSTRRRVKHRMGGRRIVAMRKFDSALPYIINGAIKKVGIRCFIHYHQLHERPTIAKGM